MKSLLLLLLFQFVHNQSLGQTNDSLFHEQPIELRTNSGTLYGTLTLPTGVKKMPVALLIAGSGPTDRNGNNTMMKNDGLKMIAHELAKKQIATVRYDKRGIAASATAMTAEKDLLFDLYVQDASDWISMLRKNKQFTSMTVIGHSEGSLIAMLSATRPDKLISIAGAGFPAADILKKQLETQPPKIKEASYAILDSLSAGQLVDSVPPYLNALFRRSVQPYLISWFRHDPSIALKALMIPTLIIQGNADIQVSVQDAERLKAAQPMAKLVIIDSMNHVLKITSIDRKENLKTYFDPAIPISVKLIAVVSEFIYQKHL